MELKVSVCLNLEFNKELVEACSSLEEFIVEMEKERVMELPYREVWMLLQEMIVKNGGVRHVQ